MQPEFPRWIFGALESARLSKFEPEEHAGMPEHQYVNYYRCPYDGPNGLTFGVAAAMTNARSVVSRISSRIKVRRSYTRALDSASRLSAPLLGATRRRSRFRS